MNLQTGVAMKRARIPAGMIDIRKFPAYFTSDSIARHIFQPEDDNYASPEQVRELLADAEFYTDKYRPEQCPPGLIRSAHAVLRHCKKALGIEDR